MRTRPTLSALCLIGLYCLLSIAICLTPTADSGGAVPSLINYQGKLTTADGGCLNDTVFMTFTIYSDDQGTVVDWTEVQDSVIVKEGIFNVLLGRVNPIPDTVFDGSIKYLGVQVESDPEMRPLKPMVTVAYAFHSATADTAYNVATVGLVSVDGVSNPGGDVDLTETDAIAIVSDDGANTITFGETHSPRIDNPHQVTASQTGALVSADGVSNPGGDVDFTQQDAITITPNDGNNTITFGETHSARTDNPHQVAAAQTGALVSVDGVDNAGGDVDFIAGANMTITPNATGNNITFSASGGAGGWVDDGTTVRLETSSDYVGIGTLSPSGKLHVESSDLYSGYFTSDSLSINTHVVHAEFTGTGSHQAKAVYGKCTPADHYGYGGYFEGGYIGVYSSVNPTGSVYPGYFGVVGSVVGGSGTNYGVYGNAGGSGINYAGYFDGNVTVTGVLNKAGGSFNIDHPLDPENRYLYLSFVESPDMMNVYNGNVLLDANGEAKVKLPDYFEALNRDFRYQLTCIGGFAPVYIAGEISSNQFTIAGGEAGMKVSWQVTGIRKDPFAQANRIQVEVDKPAKERGKYLHPEAYGLGEEYGIHYEQHKRVGGETAGIR